MRFDPIPFSHLPYRHLLRHGSVQHGLSAAMRIRAASGLGGAADKRYFLDRTNVDPASRTALDAAEISGYLPALRALAKMACVPFWWHCVDESGSNKILHNGTVSFVDTGVRKLGITADHVLEKYLSDQARDPRVVCQFGSSTVEIRDRVVARDAKQDLASLDLSDVLVGGTWASFHAPPRWPPPPVADGDVVLCGGYPGNLRVEHSVTADLPFQWFIGRVTNASAHRFSLHLDFENMHTPMGDSKVLNKIIGGMSGGPIFRVVSSPIERLEQVGVISELHKSYELLIARPTLFVSADGSIAPEDAIYP